MAKRDSLIIMRELNDKKQAVKAHFDAGEHDEGLKASGAVEQLYNELTAAIDEENQIRLRAGEAPEPVAAAPEQPRTLTDLFLGPRDKFDRLPKNYSVTLHGNEGRVVYNEGTGDAEEEPVTPAPPATITLPQPEVREESIPTNFAPQMGFLNTILHGSTKGDIEYYLPTDRVYPGVWTEGSLKKQVTMSWQKIWARMSTVAALTVVSEKTLADYTQLRSVIENELRLGHDVMKGVYALLANETDGMVGILNNPNIQKPSNSQGNAIDVVRRSITKSVMATGLYPNHVCMQPLLHEDMDLAKATNGEYLALTLNGRVWGLPISDDLYMGSETHPGLMVYNSAAATFYTQHIDRLAVGTVNDQFARNQLTLRLEGSYGIKVTRPESFVYHSFTANDAGVMEVDDTAVVPSVTLE